MILYSASFKPKGFGIKKYIRILSNDTAVVCDKRISKRKSRKLIKYIVSENERLLNNSHLDIASYGCYSESEIISQFCEVILSKCDDVLINDTDGYAAQPLKKLISRFSSVKIFGNTVYKEIQEQVYRSSGICIILSDEKIHNAIDTKNIKESLRKTFTEADGVKVTYLDIFRYYGIKCEGTDKFINMISQCKNP